MRIAITLAFILALAVPGHASYDPWDAVARAVFRLYLFPDARAGICTAWATAPAADEQQSYYITAGHCEIAKYIIDSGRFVRSPLRASSSADPSDVGIGIRPDHRVHRAFLPLDPTPGRPGDRVLGIGFPDGMLMASTMTVMGYTTNGLIALRSSIPLVGGWSGAPLVSLATGSVIGVLEGRAERDPQIAVAVPAATVRAVLEGVQSQAPDANSPTPSSAAVTSAP
jgi:hypothetical protein